MAESGTSGFHAVDLTSCEREPIHVPGLIQPHGLLLVLDEPDLVVRQISANAEAILAVPVSAMLDRPLDDLLGPAQLAQLRMVAGAADPGQFNPVRLTIPVRGERRPFEALVHRSDGALVVELESARDDIGDFSEFYRSVQRATVRLQTTGDVASLCETVTCEVRRITGFDRVMVYRFDPEWNGEVVAESQADGLDPVYLGLRFPASDIPPQARRLYETNLVRVIPDVGYEPAPLIPGDASPPACPLDMSRCALRSVSPMHVEYLRNMGVAATLTISVVCGGKLWGLVACHHRRARAIPFERRRTCEFLGQIFAAQLSIREDGEDRIYRLGTTSLQAKLLEQMAVVTPSIWGLVAGRPSVLDLVEAGGAAVVWGGECRTIGATPADTVIMELVGWLSREAVREVFATDALADAFPPAASCWEVASGVLALELSRERREYVLWFRPELVRVVNWAGDPNKPVVVEDPSGTARLHPRRSFDLWKQSVRMRSRPWRPRELAAAAELRSTIRGVIASEEQLHARSRRQAALAELGQRALACIDLESLFREAVTLVARTLDVPVCNLLRARRGGELEIQATGSVSGGWGTGGEPPRSQFPLAAYSLACGAPVIADDFVMESRFDALELHEDHGFAGGIAAPLADASECYGVLVVYSDRPRRFDQEESHFLTVAANVLVTAVRRRGVEQALEHQSRHDGLTGLPNRTLLMDRLRAAIDAAGRDGMALALMLIDLDRFKEINDTYGHHYGDELLRQASGRFLAVLGESGTAARLGGDEFAVVLPSAARGDADRTASAILAELGRAFLMEGGELCEVGGSVGIALFPEHGEDASTLMRRADVAMYAAKRAGGGGSMFYSTELDRYAPSRLALVGELRRAIEDGQLSLVYQPKMDLRRRQLAGVEALIRWRHPLHGLLSPGQFVPTAERTGLIGPLDRWVLRQVLAQSRRWQAAGIELGVAVNVSPHSLHDGDLFGALFNLKEEMGLLASGLTIEVTEGALMSDPQGAAETLRRLREELGVRISIDDFGTGYSSLAYLKRLPVDEVKIDRGFVRPMLAEPKDASIVRTVIELGHNLELSVVAEGVEDAGTLERLAALGCDQAQGYYVSRPKSAHDLTAMLGGRAFQLTVA